MPKYIVSLPKGAPPRTFFGVGTVTSDEQVFELSEDQAKSLQDKGLRVKPVKEANNAVSKE